MNGSLHNHVLTPGRTMPRAATAAETKLQPWQEAWDAFLKEAKKSAITRSNYRSYAKKIDLFRAQRNITRPDDFTEALEGEFLEQFEVKTTRWTYQKALKAFFNWGLKHDWRHRPSRTERIEIKLLDEPLDHVGHPMLAMLKAEASPRDRAVLTFTFQMGARASEVRNAKLADYHRSEHTMAIDQPKQGTRRTMYLDDATWRELNHYIDKIRPQQAEKLTPNGKRKEGARPETVQPWLFLTTKRDRGEFGDFRQLTASGLASIFRRLRLEQGIESGKLSAQLLRRGRATELANKTQDTVWLMRVMGWADARSLRRYLVQSLEQDRKIIEQIERERVD
jgi:integrase